MNRLERITKIFDRIDKSRENYINFACLTDDQVEEAYYEILGIE